MSLTMRERMLAFIQGRELDRVPFAQYDIMVPMEETWKLLGRENIGQLRWTQAHRFEHPACRFDTESIMIDGRCGLRTTLHTPEGTLVEEKAFDPVFESAATRHHFIRRVEDYKPFLAYLRDITVHPDFEPLLQTMRDLGEDGLPHCWVGRTPFQQLWVQWVSLQDLCLHMVYHPELMEEVFAELGRIMRAIFRAIRNAPMPYIVIGDNITAPAIGLDNFRQYCVPFYNELAGLLDERNVPLACHMDGDLKPLWDDIGASRVTLLDSFSPPPDNDTPVGEALRMWPDKKLMLNFPSSIHLKEPAEIRRCAGQILEEGGHTGRLMIQISENVPPGIWKTSYPEIAAAIRAFGKP